MLMLMLLLMIDAVVSSLSVGVPFGVLIVINWNSECDIEMSSIFGSGRMRLMHVSTLLKEGNEEMKIGQVVIKEGIMLSAGWDLPGLRLNKKDRDKEWSTRKEGPEAWKSGDATEW
jgi:hypothetical protein